MDILAAARKVFDIEISELQVAAEKIDQAFIDAVDCLKACCDRKSKVIVLGVGKSGHIGEKIAATLTSTGCPSIVLNSLNALHGDLGIISDGDVVLALSYSGETEELTNILNALARFNVQIISITGNPSSTLAKASNITLNVKVEREACPLNLAPTSSTTVMLVLGDALAMTLLEARGFKKEDFARFHPGGRLGRELLLRVDQIMRGRDLLALVSPRATVVETIKEMTSKKCGAAIVVYPDDRLAGIFTHGDFARHFPENPNIGAEPVEKYMTPDPIHISSNKLAVEVLYVLQTHRIDDLIVLDEQRRPVGIVDSQDLSRHRLI